MRHIWGFWLHSGSLINYCIYSLKKYSCTTDKNIFDFILVRNSYLTHVIIPRLSREGCSLVVLKLMHMVVNLCPCSVTVTSSCIN